MKVQELGFVYRTKGFKLLPFFSNSVIALFETYVATIRLSLKLKLSMFSINYHCSSLGKKQHPEANCIRNLEIDDKFSKQSTS